MNVKCPICFSTEVEPVDSYTIIDGSSLYRQESRYDKDGEFEALIKPIYKGNKTKYHCRHCGFNFVNKTRDDEVAAIKER